MFRPVRTTAPTEDVLTLEEVKAHCRVDSDDSDSDAVLTALVRAATDHLDGWSGVLGRCLVNQEWRIDLPRWRPEIRLPFPDVSDVSVKYSDADDEEQTYDADLVEVLEDARGSFLRFRVGFTAPILYDDRSDPVRVTFTAGYGATADDVPGAIRTAMLMLVGHWYENREAVAADVSPAPVPMAVDALIAPYRRLRI